MTQFIPSTEEAALQAWLALAVSGLNPTPEVIFSDQGKPRPNNPFVTLKVLSEVGESSKPETVVLDNELPNGNFQEQVIARYAGTVSVQVYGANHVRIARRIENSLSFASVKQLNADNNISVSGSINGRLNSTLPLKTRFEQRSIIDFQYYFTDCIDSPEGVEVIETVIATGDVGPVSITAQAP